MNQSQDKSLYDVLNLQAELEMARAQQEDYKSKYFQAQKEIENKNQEIESLRLMLQQTQSLRSTDPRQAEDIKITLQQLQLENKNLKTQVQQLQQLGQQPNQNQSQQETFELQQQILSYQNELQRNQNQYQSLQVQFEGKKQDFIQLKSRVQAWDLLNNLPVGQEKNRQLVLEREFQRINQMMDKKDRELEEMRRTVEEQRIEVGEKVELSRQLRDYEDKIVILSREIERMLASVGSLRYDVLLKQQLDNTKQSLNETDKQCKEWKEKYQQLEADSKHVGELERIKKDLEDRIILLQTQNDKIELENRGLQLRQQAFDRLLKENDSLQQKIQNLDNQLGEVEKALAEKRRENEAVRRKKNEVDEDFTNFKENILRPQEERAKRLEVEVENWRNKCVALENNFFGNNDRTYAQNEFKRLNSIIQGMQQENDQIKIKLRQQQHMPAELVDNSFNEERIKILYNERERLFQEIEQIKRKCMLLEQETSILKQQGARSSQQKTQHISIIQEGKNAQDNDYKQELIEKDNQLEDLKKGIEQLIDENKALKQEITTMQNKMEQIEIEKGYALQKQLLYNYDQNLTIIDILARLEMKDFNIKERSYQHLAYWLNEQLQNKKQELMQFQKGLKTDQQLLDETVQKNNQIKILTQQLSNNQDDEQPIIKMTIKIQQLQERISDLENKSSQEFLNLIERKEEELKIIRLKFNDFSNNKDQNNNYIRDIKRLKDLLEEKSYECEEWKDKYKLKQVYVNKQYEPSDQILEQEFRKIRHLLELKSIESEEYKQRLMNNNITLNHNDTDTEYRKSKMLLEMRTAECEEWRQKCIRLQQQGNVARIPINDLKNEDTLKKRIRVFEQRELENEDWKGRYMETLKGGQSVQPIEEIQTKIQKIQRQYELKCIELQELQPRLQRIPDILRERDILENQLRQVKQVLEQQIIDNEQLKRRISNIGQDANNPDKSVLERQVREQQKLIQSLQNELQKAGVLIQQKHQENDKLKQTTIHHHDQIQSIAMGHTHIERKAKDTAEDYERVKQGILEYRKETENLKEQLRQIQLQLNNSQKVNTIQQDKEIQELRRVAQSVESLKAQLQIMAHRLQDSEQKMQQMRDQMVKIGNVLKDKAIENEKMKNEMKKFDSYQRDREQMQQQMEQLKQQLQVKQKENDQMKQALMNTQKKMQENDKQYLVIKEKNDKLSKMMGQFGMQQ